jgi:serine/threonine protein kinase
VLTGNVMASDLPTRVLGSSSVLTPEQTKGRAADKRSDVWAFGCVLYEMLIAKRAFEGEDVSDTLATVLKAEPDWDPLPSDVPPAIAALIRRGPEGSPCADR